MATYKYDISMVYIYNNIPITIKRENFYNLLIDYDYDDKNMPIMYATVAIDKNILDDMLLNNTKKYVTLTIKKFIDTESSPLKIDYINDEFIYFLPKSLNINKTIDYNDATDNDIVLKTITMGFMSLKLLNNNKQLINDIFINTSKSAMLCKYASNMKLLLEPMPNDKSFDRFIVPPLTSFTEFVTYLNDKLGLYDTRYRLFYDFNKTYLVSSSGNKVKSYSDKIENIIFGIKDTTSAASKDEGGEFINNSYNINIDMEDVTVFTNEINTLQYNSLIGVGSDGKFKKVNIKDDRIDNTEKISIVRYNTDNLNNVQISKKRIESGINSLNIVKSDLDSSMFTINKEYQIMNYYKLGYLTGKYLLKRKREIYIPYGNNYTLSTMLTLNKIDS